MPLLRRNPASRGVLSRARQSLFNPSAMRGAGKNVAEILKKHSIAAQRRGMTMEQFEEERLLFDKMRTRERNAEVEAMEFEHVNARKTHEADSKKQLMEATEKIHNIISLEVESSMGKILAGEIAKALGHEAISQISAEQLRQLLAKSPRLKSIIMRLKGGALGGRKAIMIDKRELGEAMEEIKEILQQAMQ